MLTRQLNRSTTKTRCAGLTNAFFAALYVKEHKVLLIEPNSSNIETMLKQHDEDGGNSINDSLTKLFNSLEDETNKYEVSISITSSVIQQEKLMHNTLMKVILFYL